MSNDKTVRGFTVQSLKHFDTQFLATQDEKEKQIVFRMLAIKKLLI